MIENENNQGSFTPLVVASATTHNNNIVRSYTMLTIKNRQPDKRRIGAGINYI